MITNSTAIYLNNWTGLNSPAAFAAFRSGLDAAIEMLSDSLSDEPSVYEEAKSAEQWKDYLTTLINNNQNISTPHSQTQ